jgi:hypothetical protein
MSDKPSSNEQLENIKRAGSEVIADMKSRNLLLPAIVIAVAIVAALIVLPNKSAPVTQDVATQIPVHSTPVSTEKAIEITLITPTAVGEKTPLTSSSNPFEGDKNYSCKTISSGTPKVLQCEVSGMSVRVVCPKDATGEPCTSGSSSGATGGTGSTSGTSTGGSTGGGSIPGVTTPDSPVVYYVYVVKVTLDGKTFNKVEPGTVLPRTGTTIVSFVSVTDSRTRAGFTAAAGSTVTGVSTTSNGLDFVLKKNQSATITDSLGAVHTLKLISISKVKL